MLLSAFLEAGFKKSSLDKLVESLHLKDVKIITSKKTVGHIEATSVRFKLKKNINFSFSKINNLINKASLSASVKNNSLNTYKLLKQIEEKVHGHKHKDFKFQHLGEIDAIVEIVSFWQALEDLGIGDCFCSIFILSKTSPAALQLLKGKKVRFVDWGYESVTPTAAALLRDFPQEELEVYPEAVGYGAGDYSGKGKSDFLRIVISKRIESVCRTIKLEVNLDDINPQVFDYIMDLLFSSGAQDVYIVPVIMKKSRPAFVLTVLLDKKDLDKIKQIIFRETTTFGLRYAEFKKEKLAYTFIRKKTPFGKVQYRRGILDNNLVKESPEYNDCKRIASKYNIPLVEVYKRLNT